MMGKQMVQSLKVGTKLDCENLFNDMSLLLSKIPVAILAGGLATRLRAFLPLPAGEGRGEGEL